MFDKLIVSEPEGADFKNRRNYFVVSSIAVGALFLTAVVVSIYASDYGLGHNSFELVDMVAPPVAAVEPEPKREQAPATPSRSTSQLPTREVNIVNINESPIVPPTISTTQNTQMQRPETGRFTVGKFNSDPTGTSGVGSERTSGGGPEVGGGLSQNTPVAETEKETAPPTAKPVVTKPSPPKSEGVMNGKATNLPKPIYSAAAKAVGAQGIVNVQITVDEAGNVISANAVSGHPLLRSPAEQAARNAKFSITYLSRVPVKVTGVIVYNFIK